MLPIDSFIDVVISTLNILYHVAGLKKGLEVHQDLAIYLKTSGKYKY